jgi:lysine N6-hydroxylase
MKDETVYDIIGIGIGPFNLGLAALLEKLPQLSSRFIDQSPSFDWHPGLLLPNTRLQVPFLADLVTLADPTSKFSFVNFLKMNGRMIQFAIQENNFVTRFEYNQYCQWVVSQLSNLHFGLKCESIQFDETANTYIVYVREPGGFPVRFHGKQIVIGVGTVPSFPECVEDIEHPFVFHSSDYLYKKDSLLSKKHITLVGSGQSAAEIFYDLLQYTCQFESLSWFTRSEYPYPMDNSKFGFEMTSPDYIRYFYNLSARRRKEILGTQNRNYKGINKELIDAIHASMYQNLIHNSSYKTAIFPNCELRHIDILSNNQLKQNYFHLGQKRYFPWSSDGCILATGYKNTIPEFLHSVKELINWTQDEFYQVNLNYSVDNQNSIFVQNADLHSHGFNSADLGMGPHRNAVILNTILKEEHFKMEKNIAFQKFGAPLV